MKRGLVLTVAFAVLLSGAARADILVPFQNEPVDHWPNQWELPTGEWITNDWVTQPYHFDNGLDPWQAKYQGTDDPVLYPSDVLYPGTAFVWFDNDADFQGDGVAKRFGLIGIDNRRGTDNVTSGIQFVIDNWDHPNEWKHIWKEILYFAGPGFEEEEQLSVPDNYTTLEQTVMNEDLGDNWAVLDVAYKVYPNPPWEQVTIIVRVPPGSFILADEIHFATECVVPEPASTLLTITGFGTALLALRRRRRR